MHIDDVITVIERRGWGENDRKGRRRKKWGWAYFIDHENGYIIQGLIVPGFPTSESMRGSIIGEQSIRTVLGEYMCILNTAVSASWGFDADGYLIKVHVRKQMDML